MKLPDNIKTFATWCSFCNSEEAVGQVDTVLFDSPVTLDIGPECLKKADGQGLVEGLDTPPDR